jgi:hypothetical protein
VGLQKFEFKQQERGSKIKHSLQMFLYNGTDPFFSNAQEVGTNPF